ncbi:MAG: ABC transporter permease [Kiritimatiellaeota bacterium]|nr:ABC transporter permease [Kiritimatiellota bacterium]
MRKFHILAVKELNDLFSSKTALLFLTLASWIVGYGFATAVNLYSEQSAAAVGDLLYASGFEPVPGVFTPTFGGLFVVFSLFLPFAVIALVSLEKERGTLSLLAQLPFSFGQITMAKILASFVFVLTTVAMVSPCVIAWMMYGGHVPWAELAVLTTGYILYGMFVVSISFFAAALFDGMATASICAVFLVALSWIIDFGAAMNASMLLSGASQWTVTRTLKFFENGILSLNAVSVFLLTTALFFVISHTLLRFDIKHKWKAVIPVTAIFAVSMYAMSLATFNIDATESHRNSFPSGIVKSLRGVPKFEIDVYLTPSDSRFKDYKKSFLDKLVLLRKDVEIKMMTGGDLSKNYGLFVYKLGTKSAKTYSNSEEEVFPLIFKLAGASCAEHPQDLKYPGYPLVVKDSLFWVKLIYFLLIPLSLAICLFRAHFKSWRKT